MDHPVGQYQKEWDLKVGGRNFKGKQLTTYVVCKLKSVQITRPLSLSYPPLGSWSTHSMCNNSFALDSYTVPGDTRYLSNIIFTRMPDQHSPSWVHWSSEDHCNKLKPHLLHFLQGRQNASEKPPETKIKTHKYLLLTGGLELHTSRLWSTWTSISLLMHYGRMLLFTNESQCFDLMGLYWISHRK